MNTKDQVLVVDDEPGLREVLRITLQRQGYDVTCCSAPGRSRVSTASPAATASVA